MTLPGRILGAMARTLDELLAQFQAGARRSSTVSRLDLLLDLERSHDPRVLPILLRIMEDPDEPRAARIGALKVMRNGQVTPIGRPRIASTIVNLLANGCDPHVRLQAALALREFTEVDGVLEALGGLARDAGESIELRYAAFTALQHAEPTNAYLTLLRQLAHDELFGRVASSALRLAATDGGKAPAPNP
jgi:HEAT repeat protein